jgi:hypothetical protein
MCPLRHCPRTCPLVINCAPMQHQWRDRSLTDSALPRLSAANSRNSWRSSSHRRLGGTPAHGIACPDKSAPPVSCVSSIVRDTPLIDTDDVQHHAVLHIVTKWCSISVQLYFEVDLGHGQTMSVPPGLRCEELRQELRDIAALKQSNTLSVSLPPMVDGRRSKHSVCLLGSGTACTGCIETRGHLFTAAAHQRRLSTAHPSGILIITLCMACSG